MIGERAARAIKAKAKPGKLKEELKLLGIDPKCYYCWKRGEYDPSAYVLRKMTLAGYDVIDILIGDKKKVNHNASI